MPTRAEVSTAVVATIAGFARLRPDQVHLDYGLQALPLSMDSNGLAFLANTLRGYVKFHSQSQETVLAAEVRKCGLTVQGLVDLIVSKVSDDA